MNRLDPPIHTGNMRSGMIIPSILVGLVGAAVTISQFHMDLKWSIALLTGLIAGTFLLIKRPNVEQWLFLFFLTCSLQLNFFLVHFPMIHYSEPVRGIPIYFYDIPLLFLSFLAFYRILLCNGSFSKNWVYILPFFCAVVLAVLKSFQIGESSLKLIAMFYLMVKCLLLFLVTTFTINSRKRLLLVITAVCTAVAIHSGMAFIELLHGKPLGLSILGETHVTVSQTEAGTIMRVGGLIGNENLFSKYLGLHLPLLLALLFSPIRFRTRFFVLLPLFIVTFAANIFTYCRFGWISTSFTLMITLSLLVFKKTGRTILLFTGPLIVGFVVFLVLSTMPTVKARLSVIELGSSFIRAEQYSMAFNMIRKNPFDGVGYGKFVAVAGNYDQSISDVSRWFPAAVHNEYLLMGSELGLIVLSLYLFMLIFTTVSAFRSAWKSNDLMAWISLGLAGGLFAYALQDLTEWSWAFQLVHLWSFMACARAASLLVNESREKN